MKTANFVLILLVTVAGCGPAPGGDSLVEARKGFQTKLQPAKKGKPEPVEAPPGGVFSLVKYKAAAGELPAYLTPDPKDGKKHPAIIWITGGDCNSIGDVWSAGKAGNDQTAAQYRKAGIAMMFPSLRGGNDNPGAKEGFLGEVDDVIAAFDHLAKVDYVDPTRIYLGGHSTGGTLVLLVSECTPKFRAVFSFGPADDVSNYPKDFTPFKREGKEIELRSPIHWLAGVKSPTFVLEGTNEGNIDSLEAMAKKSKNPKLKFLQVKNATHFSVLAPMNAMIAAKIVKDHGPACAIDIAEADAKMPGR